MRLPLALLVTAAGAAGLGCNINQEGVPPQQDRIFFPGAIRLDPGQQWLYVANSNADLRFNDGTVVAIDVDAAARDRAAPRGDWADCTTPTFTARPTIFESQQDCCWDALDANVLDCDERAYVNKGATVKTGSFASAMEYQLHPDDPTRRQLLIAVRGNSSITAVDVQLGGDATNKTIAMTCTVAGSAPGAFPECDQQHRVTQVVNRPSDAQVLLPDEPYALAIDRAHEALYVGHLKGGFLSFIDLSGYRDGRTPDLLGVYASIFPGDVNGSQGVTSFTTTAPSDGRVYATSRFLPRASSFARVQRDPSAPDTNVNDVLADTGDVFTTPLTGAETRGIAFVDNVDDGSSRAFVLQRTPPALIGFDRVDSLNVPSDVIEVCSSPTFLNSYTLPSGEVRLYVTCFESGQVYVIDPYVGRVLSIIEVGRGPAGLDFSTDPNVPIAYVTGFGANNVSVIDLAQSRVVQRIGFPSAVPL